jgi:sugar phosphate isomerase/epimerase
MDVNKLLSTYVSQLQNASFYKSMANRFETRKEEKIQLEIENKIFNIIDEIHTQINRVSYDEGKYEVEAFVIKKVEIGNPNYFPRDQDKYFQQIKEFLESKGYEVVYLRMELNGKDKIDGKDFWCPKFYVKW